MGQINFDFNGPRSIVIPDGQIYEDCAKDIIEGRSYPLPVSGVGEHVKCVVDLGAHAGEFTIMAAARWPGAVVYAYEPNPQVLPLLKANCEAYYTQIAVIPKAVDVKARRDKLYFSGLGSVAASVVMPADFLKPTPDHEWSGVDVDIAGPEEVANRRPDVLKIDIEGPEGLVLRCLGDSLDGIWRIYVEFHHEDIRLDIEHTMLPTHRLEYARILQGNQGELMYEHR